MSRTWIRTPSARRCGYCGATIARGAPLQLTQIVGLDRPLIRCAQCAGEPAPELPAVVERTPIAPSFGMSRVGALAQDWKQKASGD